MNEGLKETSWPRIIHCPFLPAFLCQMPMRCTKSTSQLLPESQIPRSGTSMAHRFLTLNRGCQQSRRNLFLLLIIYLFFQFLFYFPFSPTLLHSILPTYSYLLTIVLRADVAGQSSVFSNYQFQGDHKQVSSNSVTVAIFQEERLNLQCIFSS